MTRKIFIYTFMLGAFVMFICCVVFFGLQYTRTMEETYAALQGEASYAASGLKVGGLEYLQSLDGTNRVTWIAQDGGVLYDSKYPGNAANQGEFGEVRDAFMNGSGQGIRRSSSGGEQTMYYAFLCSDGTVLRLSRPLSAVRYAFLSISPMLWVIILILVISAFMSWRIGQAIAKPVNALDLDNLSKAEVYPELYPLVERLGEQRETIENEVREREQFRREAFEQRAREREQQAQERERMRREFSANVSHELKTPLTSISGFAELMRSGLCDEEKMIEFAGDIYRESQRLIALVNDIIRLSELDEGAVKSSQEEVDLVRETFNAVQILLPAAEQRGIHIRVETGPGQQEGPDALQQSGEGSEHSAGQFPGTEQPEASTDRSVPGSVTVYGSPHLIAEMIYNLCDNAVKYNREGGSVEIRVWEDAKNAFLSVEDTGIGIPEDEQERVFERFYRVDKSHSRKIGGTGLGLSIVKHAAQFHGASVEMDSRPGEGTKITLCFPKYPLTEAGNAV